MARLEESHLQVYEDSMKLLSSDTLRFPSMKPKKERCAGEHLLERFLSERWMYVEGLAIGDVPMGIFNANFSVIFNSVVVFTSSLNFSKFLDRES